MFVIWELSQDRQANNISDWMKTVEFESMIWNLKIEDLRLETQGMKFRCLIWWKSSKFAPTFWVHSIAVGGEDWKIGEFDDCRIEVWSLRFFVEMLDCDPNESIWKKSPFLLQSYSFIMLQVRNPAIHFFRYRKELNPRMTFLTPRIKWSAEMLMNLKMYPGQEISWRRRCYLRW